MSYEFIDLISNHKKISKVDASKMINECIKMISKRLNISLSDIQNILNSDFGIQYISDTIEYKGRQVPLMIQNYESINRDPDKYLMKMSKIELEELRDLAAYLYFNYSGGGLTDNSFDAIQYYLNKKYKSKYLQDVKIGAPPVDKIKVTLPYPMASLDKVKPNTQELTNFLNLSTEFVVSLKLDGISGMLVYKDNKLEVYTRGNGVEGGLVSYVQDYITFPSVDSILKSNNNLVVRGEFVIKKSVWSEKYKNISSNARNFVSGKLNTGFVHPALVDIDFVAYDIIAIDDDRLSPKDSLDFLKVYGFNTVYYNIYTKRPLTIQLIESYKQHRLDSEYDIDGLVLSVEHSRHIQTELRNPSDSVAFKMQLEEQIRETSIINIDWDVSRYGRYVPVAVFNSVYINGVRVHRASAFNASKVKMWHMGSGTKIHIIRSGDVIPVIKHVDIDKNIPIIYPTKDENDKLYKGDWIFQKLDIIVTDIENNKFVQIKRIIHFFEVIGVPGLRDATALKLWGSGFRNVESITNANISDFKKIKGFGQKRAETMYNNIHTILQKTRLDRFIPASTTIKGLGRDTIKVLLNHYPSLVEDDQETVVRMMHTIKIPGIGPKRIESVINGIEKFKDFLFGLNEYDIQIAIQNDKRHKHDMKTKIKNPLINTFEFVMTNFMKDLYDFEDYIMDEGGRFGNVVSKKTTAVISGNILISSSKTQEAISAGIPIYSLEEFVREFNIPPTIIGKNRDYGDNTDE